MVFIDSSRWKSICFMDPEILERVVLSKKVNTYLKLYSYFSVVKNGILTLFTYHSPDNGNDSLTI